MVSKDRLTAYVMYFHVLSSRFGMVSWPGAKAELLDLYEQGALLGRL